MVKVKIGEKSVLIRHVVRRNRDAGQYRKGRAWKEVSASHADLVRAWRTYERACLAIMRLPGHAKLQQQFQNIAREDLKEIKDITHANRVGQRQVCPCCRSHGHGDRREGRGNGRGATFTDKRQWVAKQTDMHSVWHSSHRWPFKWTICMRMDTGRTNGTMAMSICMALGRLNGP
jgi:hypothetical protein